MTDSLKSFSEYGFFQAFDSFYLKYLYPSNCEDKAIPNPSFSIIDTLDMSQVNIFDAKEIDDISHLLLKPVRVIARLVYSIGIMSIFSTSGTIYYGGFTAKHLTLYMYQWLFGNNEQEINNEWELTEKYGAPFLIDLSGTIIGALNVACLAGSYFILVDPILHISDLLSKVFLSCLLLGLSLWSSSAIWPESGLPRILAYDDSRVGMYISLALRNHFGLKTENDPFLPYSSKDHMEVTFDRLNEYGYEKETAYVSGEQFRKLQMLTVASQVEFFHAWGLAIKFLTNKGISSNLYSCPITIDDYDHNQNIDSLKKASETLKEEDRPEFLKMIEKIDSLYRKKDFFRTILQTSAELAMNGGMLFILLTWLAKKPTFSFPMEGYWELPSDLAHQVKDNAQGVYTKPSYSNPSYDNTYFETAIDTSVWRTYLINSNQIESLQGDLSSINPNNNTTFEDWLKWAQILKWNYEQNSTNPYFNVPSPSDRDYNTKKVAFCKFLGLEESASPADIRARYRKISLQVHPNRNLNNQQLAGALYQFYTEIYYLLLPSQRPTATFDNTWQKTANFNQ